MSIAALYQSVNFKAKNGSLIDHELPPQHHALPNSLRYGRPVPERTFGERGVNHCAGNVAVGKRGRARYLNAVHDFHNGRPPVKLLLGDQHVLGFAKAGHFLSFQ